MFDWVLNMPLFPVKNKKRNYLARKTLRPLFMDEIQLSQDYRATKREQFTFYNSVTRNSWYSFNRPRNYERMWFTLELPSGFESGTPGLGNQHPNHYDNWAEVC